MPKRINKLTQAQKDQIPAWVEKWIKIGLQTGPADREGFERGVKECYRFAHLAEPKAIVWVPSPLVIALAAPIAAHIISKGKSVGEAVAGAVRGAVGGAVGEAVDEAVDEAVAEAVDGAVGEAVREAVERDWLNYMGGQFLVGGWWGSPSFVSYFREVCGLELPKDFDARALAYEATCRSACWWWPHTGFVMVCERPSEIHRNAAGRLHRDGGKAIVWPDGWGVYSLNGVTVPEWCLT
jgi:hypothetical protein